MSKLVIKLNGEIEQSNFDDWKTDLTAKLKAVKTELVSDSDFAEASDQVKAFKKAEKNLKTAKTSAIKQAADINQLFDAIDAVASETRNIRLQLERQIKTRKAAIKQDAIAAAAAKVQAIFNSQSEDFQLLNSADFSDLSIYTEAVKGSRGKSGMQTALDTVCKQMEENIAARAKTVKLNATTIDSLASGHQIAFQDRAFLLAKAPEQLDAIIDERLATLEKLAASTSASKSAEEATKDAEKESAEETTNESDSADNETLSKAATTTSEHGDLYEITLHLRASEQTVLQTMDDIKKTYREQPGFVEVTLKSADL